MISDTAMKKELKLKFGDTVTTGQLGQYSKEYMQRARQGALDLVSRGVWAITPKGAQLATADDDDGDELGTEADEVVDAELIKKRFTMLTTLGDGIVAGNIRSLIVSGSAGVGKTYTLERQLEAAEKNGKIKSYDATKGTISAIGLYEALYNNRRKGQVMLLDDTDRVFFDEEAINILKAALDTSAVRTISWSKASRTLKDADIPNRFQYEGQIIFITNTDLDKVVDKGGRLSPHISALLSRSIFLDLCIHSPKAIMVRVEQVLKDSTLAQDLGLTKQEVNEVVKWMTENLAALRSVSIRTVTQLGGFMKTTAEWKDMAQVTLLKKGM